MHNHLHSRWVFQSFPFNCCRVASRVPVIEPSDSARYSWLASLIFELAKLSYLCYGLVTEPSSPVIFLIVDLNMASLGTRLTSWSWASPSSSLLRAFNPHESPLSVVCINQTVVSEGISVLSSERRCSSVILSLRRLVAAKGPSFLDEIYPNVLVSLHIFNYFK
jgi:hypothetical protein